MTEHLIDTNVRLIEAGGELGVEISQEIPDEFLQELQDRFVGTTDPSGEFLCAAVIPTAIVDKWLREGYNVYEEPIANSVARLRAENLTKFITTSKRL